MNNILIVISVLASVSWFFYCSSTLVDQFTYQPKYSAFRTGRPVSVHIYQLSVVQYSMCALFTETC